MLVIDLWIKAKKGNAMKLFVILFILALGAILMLCNYKNKTFRTIKLRILSPLVLSVLAICAIGSLISGCAVVPVPLRHLCYVAFPPEDSHDSFLLADDFDFLEKGFSKTYALNLKYPVAHVIGFSVETPYLPATYEFNGTLKAEFYFKEKMVFSQIITSQVSVTYANLDTYLVNSVLLWEFPVPLENKYKKHLTLKLTNLEPDETLLQYKDSITLFVRISPYLI